jgi:acyl-CoA synthetase (AMP-forming)/AMP-acid ligase II
MLLDLIAFWAGRAPTSKALLAPGRGSLDWRGLYDQIRSAGAVLNEGGVGQAQRVALLLTNGPEAAAAFLAVSSHAVAVPLDPDLGIDELGNLLREMRVDALVAGDSRSPLADPLAAEFGLPLFRLNAIPDAAAGRFTLRGNSALGPARQGGPSRSGADAVLLRTSGTTGRSKIVPLTHDNIMATAAKTIEMMALAPVDRCLCLAPFFHKQGLVTGLTVPLAAGGSVIYPPAFDPTAFFAWMDEFAPSWYIAGPAVHEAIVRQAPLHRDTIARRRLRFIRSGAAALPPALMQALERIFEAPVIEAYGMSEAGIACNPLPPGVRKPGKVGLPITEVAIMGPAGEALAVGEIGEIAVRGACVTRGYDNSPSENAERFRQVWFYTGDEGRLDADGYLEVTGRRKEMINRGGRKVDPHDVEDLLRRHPDVSEAVGFPIPIQAWAKILPPPWC